MTITVTPVNDAPVAVNDTYTTAYETAVIILAPGILANDIDAEGDTLSVVLQDDVIETKALHRFGEFDRNAQNGCRDRGEPNLRHVARRHITV